jgi:hypothetical protein
LRSHQGNAACLNLIYTEKQIVVINLGGVPNPLPHLVPVARARWIILKVGASIR